MGGPGSGRLPASDRVKALRGHPSHAGPPKGSHPTPEAIIRAESLEALGDELLKAARTRAKNWRDDLKTALTCFEAAGKLRYRAAAAPPVVIEPSAAPGTFEGMLAAREARG